MYADDLRRIVVIVRMGLCTQTCPVARPLGRVRCVHAVDKVHCLAVRRLGPLALGGNLRSQVSVQAGQPWFTGISKASLASGAVEATWAPAGVFPCEPIFVPRPGGTAEDDGVLLSVVLSGAPCVRAAF